ncbi:hypothetical protein FNH22_22820 [Fulvivirga sp. M361]|uniref:hypothetical protein n=1 Tax=Fulvivirga sp. M361 TaxID=2594266 RepID=UPI00117A8CF1|nr:hypothetical protein [Fulvivirga sp. M361]TRX52009.1 hypothetical protein FNH22_22820 [Fulvivirga sp. M361]
MSLISNLFGKKKKAFKASCDISKEPLEKGFGYLLTTSQIVSSKKFWDNIMTEPETMSYTISHFKGGDEMATRVRSMIFEKHSTVEKPWIISDSYIHLFDVNKEEARSDAHKWWEQEGSFVPNQVGKAEDTMATSDFEEVKNYAVMEAGRERVD